MAAISTIEVSHLWPGFDLAAEHYHPRKLEALRQLGRESTSTLGDHFRHIREIVLPTSDDEGFYDTGSASAHVLPITPPSSEERISAKKIARGGDIVISRLRSYLRQVAVVPSQKSEAKLSTEFIVLRVNTKDQSWWALPFLLSEPVQTCLTWSQDGNQHPRFDEDVLLRMAVPRRVLEESTHLAHLVARAVSLRLGASDHTGAAEAQLMLALELNKLDLSPQKTYTRRFRDLKHEGRFDAEYFNPKYQKVLRKLRASGLTLADVAPISRRTFNPALHKRGSTFNYIEIGSLTGDGEADAETIDVADAPSRAKWIVKPGDIITSTVRPIRRLSALIRPEQDGFVCSSGFAVLTPKTGKDAVEPEVLLTYLRLPIICQLLDLNCTASMYPAIPEDRLMRMPFVVPDTKTRKFVVEKVNDAIAARREAARLLEQAKKTVENLIAG